MGTKEYTFYSVSIPHSSDDPQYYVTVVIASNRLFFFFWSFYTRDGSGIWRITVIYVKYIYFSDNEREKKKRGGGKAVGVMHGQFPASVIRASEHRRDKEGQGMIFIFFCIQSSL